MRIWTNSAWALAKEKQLSQVIISLLLNSRVFELKHKVVTLWRDAYDIIMHAPSG